MHYYTVKIYTTPSYTWLKSQIEHDLTAIGVKYVREKDTLKNVCCTDAQKNYLCGYVRAINTAVPKKARITLTYEHAEA